VLGGRVEKVLVHVVGAGQQLLEVPETNSKRNRQADGGPQRKAAAHPVAKLKDVFRCDPELASGFQIGRGGHEVTGDSVFVARCGEKP